MFKLSFFADKENKIFSNSIIKPTINPFLAKKKKKRYLLYFNVRPIRRFCRQTGFELSHNELKWIFLCKIAGEGMVESPTYLLPESTWTIFCSGSAERTSMLPWSLWWRTRTGHTQFPTGSIRYSLEAVSLSEAAAIMIKQNLLKLRLFNHLCDTRKKLKVSGNGA